MNELDPRIKEFEFHGVSHMQTAGRDSPLGEQEGLSKKSTEVTPRRLKRRFSAGEKLRILAIPRDIVIFIAYLKAGDLFTNTKKFIFGSKVANRKVIF